VSKCRSKIIKAPDDVVARDRGSDGLSAARAVVMGFGAAPRAGPITEALVSGRIVLPFNADQALAIEELAIVTAGSVIDSVSG
jgi:hypothetical protein